MRHRLTFDFACHQYQIDGVVVPSVTQITRASMPCHDANEWYMQRGTAVHAWAALIGARQDKAYGDPDSEIVGRVEACRRFYREVRPFVVEVEKRVYSVRHRYAGTLDLFAVMENRGPVIIDWKSSIEQSAPYQITGYAVALAECCNMAMPRWGYAVELNPDGYYRMSEAYDLRALKAQWLAMVRNAAGQTPAAQEKRYG